LICVYLNRTDLTHADLTNASLFDSYIANVKPIALNLIDTISLGTLSKEGTHLCNTAMPDGNIIVDSIYLN